MMIMGIGWVNCVNRLKGFDGNLLIRLLVSFVIFGLKLVMCCDVNVCRI